MEGEESRDLSVSVPVALDEWLSEKSSALGVTREELLVQLVAAYRVTDETGLAVRETADAVDEQRLEAVESSLSADFSRDLGALSDKVDSYIEDLRGRVIQVKKRSTRKRPATTPTRSSRHSNEPSVTCTTNSRRSKRRSTRYGATGQK
ncbi:hypothetical protein ACFQH3_02940 [Haladaptatus sp. GCM10025707]|uniref:hypothetical protein n=1 Tax=Haladaptatus sp. GCM10025707 TaxID=3252658 RepID=UPI00361C9583